MIVHNPNNLPTIPIADLLPSQGNLKDLSETNYKKLKNTIERRGFSYPVYVWEDDNKILHLLDGHQRQRVLMTEGWNEPIPYLKVPAKNLQEAMARLLEITSQYATITQEGIDEFIATYELNESEVYEATSFDALNKYGDDEETEIKEDEAPEVSDEPAVSKLGEIYQLGRHRVMCGDSTIKENVDALMGGVLADMVFTDPPYGMDLDTDFSSLKSKLNTFGKNQKRGGKYDKVIGDNQEYNPSHLLELADEVITWGADYYADKLPKGGSWYVWDKRLDDTSDKMYGSCFELAWSKVKHKRDIIRVKWAGLFGTETQDIKKRVHPTQKPIEVCAWFIDKLSKIDNVIVDLFLGSGSTLIACEQTNRICYGMELDPKYCDVIRKRYWKFTHDNNEDGWEDGTPVIQRG
jgi:DNA modification methylase